ncbi:hypothetical protein KAU09_02665 [Candidatus Parcubacteria bacterium]|nr:hypothetical protein [Candidatus Parcubacteria bacterium]
MAKDNKTIAIKIRFWTNDLPEKIGRKNGQIPCWTSGNVSIEANRTKGIKAQNVIFHYLDDIPRAVREIMKKSKLTVVEDVAYRLRAEERNK